MTFTFFVCFVTRVILVVLWLYTEMVYGHS